MFVLVTEKVVKDGHEVQIASVSVWLRKREVKVSIRGVVSARWSVSISSSISIP